MKLKLKLNRCSFVVWCGVVCFRKLALVLISISSDFIVIHTFCTCIIIIIPSLSPFRDVRSLIRSFAFNRLSRYFVFALICHHPDLECLLIPCSFFGLASSPFHYFQPHNIIAYFHSMPSLHPRKTLYIITFCCRCYTAFFSLLTFIVCCVCICSPSRNPAPSILIHIF